MNIDNQILRYVEGKLDKQAKKDFEKNISSDSELKLKIDILSDLYHNSISDNAPYELKEKIYQMLNIENKSIMDIAIEKSSDFFNVLRGQDCLLNINPAFITRSSNNSLLFSKEMNSYNIFCELFIDNSSNILNFKALDIKNKKIANIKFILKQSYNIVSEKYTNSNGYTDGIEIKSGNYIIDIYKNDFEIGNIKINIS